MSALESLITHTPGTAARAAVAPRPPAATGRSAWPEELDIVATCFNLLRAITTSDRVMAKNSQVTPQQYVAMLEIHFCDDPEPLTVGGLAGRLNIKHNCAVFIANKLCKKGYLVRIPSRRDHRRVHLKLTAKGRGLLCELARADRQQSAAAVARFLAPA